MARAPVPGRMRFRMDPDPPVRDQSLDIVYDFAGLSNETTTVIVKVTPPCSETSYEVDRDNPTVTMTVPPDAVDILATDKSGESRDLARPVAQEEGAG